VICIDSLENIQFGKKAFEKLSKLAFMLQKLLKVMQMMKLILFPKIGKILPVYL